MHSHKGNSPNPLPNPDLTDHTYLHQHHNRMNMPPSILENIQENYNLNDNAYDNNQYQYNMNGGENGLYGRQKDYQDNYGDYDTNGIPNPTTNNYLQNKTSIQYGSDREFIPHGTQPIVNHMRPVYSHQGSSYQLKDPIYDQQRQLTYLTKTESPYMSKERIGGPDLYSPRGSHYSLKSPPSNAGLYSESVHSVHSLLKNDYQVRVMSVVRQRSN